MTQDQLNETWRKIQEGEYGNTPIRPVEIAAEDGKDIMSIPNEEGTDRTIYERKNGEPWKEVPLSGGASQFEGTGA